jgi:ubiquinol-cytochrome c reductase iron-sulfur subunit
MASMTPSADVLALANAEVDVGAVAPGQGMTIKWRGKPIFIRRRTDDEIAEMKVCNTYICIHVVACFA